MNRNKGLDGFRIIASLMVIAIHVFPFSSINPDLDKLITLGLFRIAVPFFFTLTGFFLLAPLEEKRVYLREEAYRKTLFSLSKLYLLATIIYLPLSILNKTIYPSISLFEFLGLIIFDASFYHLWYFPSMILGLIIVNGLLKKLGLKVTALLALGLYIIGLLGDSYYSILGHRISFFKYIFKFSSYTRNGLFFAPIFLVLSIYIYRSTRPVGKKDYILMTLGLMGIMAEAYLVNIVYSPRHNSMYICLPITIFFLFRILKSMKIDLRLKNVSKLSTIVYLVHPMVIYGYYLFEKLFFKIDNSLVEYILVSLISFILAYILKDLKPRKNKYQPSFSRSTKEVNLANLRHNLREIRSILNEGSQIMAVVKTNSYGHGMESIRELSKNGVKYFSVATIDEGIAMRKAGIDGEILIFGYTAPDRIEDLIYYDLSLSIIDYDYALDLNHLKRRIKCQIKVDTGMHRLGIDSRDKDKILDLYRLKYLDIQGIYSHLGSSDSLDLESKKRTKLQIESYDQVLSYLRKNNINPGLSHLQSSYGILNYHELNYDLVRAGVILFGCKSSKDDISKLKPDLKPVMTLRASLIQIKEVEAQEYIGYGLNYRSKKPLKIGVLSIGYADGLARSLSNSNFSFSHQGQEIGIIGNICMDMIIVDLSRLDNIRVGDEISIMESAENLAQPLKTLTNEVLSKISPRNIEKIIP